MAATPKGATVIFKGLSTGQTYAKDLYNPDVLGSLCKWDSGAGAGASSADFCTFDEPVTMVDISAVSTIVDTTKMRLISNGVPSSNVLTWATHLNTLNNRPQLNIGFRAGSRIQLLCL